MRAVSKSAGAVLDLLTEGLDKPGDSRKIDNASPSFMAVSVERISDRPPQFSVAHYYEQNGDLMRDPEMVFWHAPDGSWYPTYFLQDNVGVEQTSVKFDDIGNVEGYYPKMQADHASFAGTWMRNIKSQQELKAPRRASEGGLPRGDWGWLADGREVFIPDLKITDLASLDAATGGRNGTYVYHPVRGYSTSLAVEAPGGRIVGWIPIEMTGYPDVRAWMQDNQPMEAKG